MSLENLRALRRGALAGARRLDLCCDLTALPPEVFDLADTLEILNLTGNRLSTLPDDLPRLHRLRVVFCSDNAFTTLPPVLGSCGQLEMVGFKANRITRVPPESLPPRLRWLILTDNAVETLPDTLGACLRLEKLMLAGNRLTTLPDLSGCGELALLRLAANRLEALPPGCCRCRDWPGWRWPATRFSTSHPMRSTAWIFHGFPGNTWCSSTCSAKEPPELSTRPHGKKASGYPQRWR